ncbi:CAP domain-containing protein [Garciella nitratireducens]|nr:CAP domain-containing protein [Garciella nitratireducens]
MKDFDINFKAAGENIAIHSTVIDAHNTLINSEEHRKNILNPNYTHIGIGIINNGLGITITQMFITKP